VSKQHLWQLIIVIAFAAAIFAIVRFKVVAVSELNETKTSSSVLTPNSEQSQRLEAEVITILPTGFQPTEISRPRGGFLLAIENRSGIKEINFQLTAESGDRVFEESRNWERSNWSEVVNPRPGRYVLTEAHHPGWQCVITIGQ
jgi:hypothetical protein